MRTGWTRADGERSCRLLLERARGSLVWAETAAAADPVFLGFWEDGWRESMPRMVDWLEREGPAIERALLA